MTYTASKTAPVNIATLKYWGKRDKTLNLPTNLSILVTLSQAHLRTLTTVRTDEHYAEDRFWLNGVPASLTSERTAACLAELRRMRAAVEAADALLPPMSRWHLHIVLENNFPTAAGLALSAAGFAALVAAIALLYQLPQLALELSVVARQGSGSACRLLFGGYVAWEMGVEADGSDLLAVEVAPRAHWPDMKAAICVVSADKKDTPSTLGMQATVQTLDLFVHRVQHVVPARFDAMKAAIALRDFATFAELTMRDSNSFHAVCLDTYPPIRYLNDTLMKIIKLVHGLNAAVGRTVAAYTFDAGPNAVVYYLHADEAVVLGALKAVTAEAEGWGGYAGEYVATEGVVLDTLIGEGVSKVILTEVGEGPLDTDEHLAELQ